MIGLVYIILSYNGCAYKKFIVILLVLHYIFSLFSFD